MICCCQYLDTYYSIDFFREIEDDDKDALFDDIEAVPANLGGKESNKHRGGHSMPICIKLVPNILNVTFPQIIFAVCRH